MFILLSIVLLGSVLRDHKVFSDPWVTSHQDWMLFPKGTSLIIILEEKPVLGDRSDLTSTVMFSSWVLHIYHLVRFGKDRSLK